VLGIVCLLWDPSRIKRRLFHERRFHFRGGTWDSRFPSTVVTLVASLEAGYEVLLHFVILIPILTRAMDQILPVGNKDA